MEIRITLDLSKPHQKYIGVTYTLSKIRTEETIMAYPTWSPGSYLIREYQSQVENLKFTNAKGQVIPSKKISKAHWLVDTTKTSVIKLHYRVYANDLNVRGLYSDQELVFINPTSAFFYPEQNTNIPVTLLIKHLPKWEIAIAKRAHNKKFRFKDVDEFYDTPILCAKELKTTFFKIKNTSYKMAFWGDHSGDIKKITNDVRDIVSKEIQIFKSNPCSEYLFQVLFVSKRFGGLEHSYSSTNIFDGSILHNDKDYRKFLSLLAHEHFHLWNVKRIRPKGLGPFDYTKEVYTRELWIAEGITSYYDDHSVMQAGKISADDYLSLIAENITKLESNKAVRVNSISDSSFDAWIRFYRQNENSMNTVTSYYLKGGLVMMLLDFRIIMQTKGRKTFDDVMRELFAMYKKRPKVGVTREEFFDVVKKITKTSFDHFANDYIDGLKSIHWKKEFEPFGIEVKQTHESNQKYLGVVLIEQKGRVIIQGIAEDSPAYESALQPLDEIIAINNQRIEETKEIDPFLMQKKITILASRLGKVYEIDVLLNGKSKPTYVLNFKKKLSAHQKKNLSRFLRKG